MKLIHINEPEHNEKVVTKQAKEILRIKPDAILFELPTQNKGSLSFFNKFKPNEKPIDILDKIKQNFNEASKIYPWLKLQHEVFNSIKKLWKKGKQVYLFEIDGPAELVSVGEGTKGILNIVWNYLREKYMIENIKRIEKEIDKAKIAMIFCHNSHWKNIQFLLKNPPKEKILDYYFTQRGINKSFKEIELELKRKNKILWKYWKKIN